MSERPRLKPECTPEPGTPGIVEQLRGELAAPAVPPGGEELREALLGPARDWQERHRHGSFVTTPDQFVNAVLALPEMRDALAAQEKLRRVEELAHSWEHPLKPERHADAARLRRALDGDS